MATIALFGSPVAILLYYLHGNLTGAAIGAVQMLVYPYAAWRLRRHGDFDGALWWCAAAAVALLVGLGLNTGGRFLPVQMWWAALSASSVLMLGSERAKPWIAACVVGFSATVTIGLALDLPPPPTSEPAILASAFVLLIWVTGSAMQLDRAYDHEIQRLQVANDALREARERSAAEAEARSRFVAWLAHEVRSPLSAVIGVGERLADADLPADSRMWVDALRHQAAALTQVVDEALSLARHDLGPVSVTPAPFEVRPLLESLVTLWGPRADDRGIHLRLHVADGVPATLVSDAVRLRQIVGNLIGNAVKFADPGLTRVDATWANDVLTLEIADPGPGVTPEIAARLFDPFYRASGDEIGGTGLGLPISRQLAEALGGTLVVRSGATGTCFTLRVPAVAAAVTAPPRGGLRVLVVDDDATHRLLSTTMLEQLGHSAAVAESGDEALRVYAAARPHLVLLDRSLPGLSGPEVARRIREHEQATGAGRVPIVVLTASSDGDEQNQCIAAGVDRVASKPIDPNILADALRMVEPPPS